MLALPADILVRAQTVILDHLLFDRQPIMELSRMF